ncbi:SDR family NAD(P)-dependent oxidoreductase [Nocardioides mangrovicus]|uniref:SDR family NAD(P)-dependent oxidoreductase n=1 Tax=Nocardioides mangrovicus TaxID=2478913 RepID=A0A3L8P407_9ACTN|nr:SDR family NAD(P)-dependent oxidoreductase [Nocardioides mangrovicus]RLV49168.1 SDR family NAD(P)-dependent oxidoreductase [Nocardioides mangrovicus]
MRTLDNKVVVVTGAGSGIGRAVAVNAAGRGALVAVSDVNDDGLAETVELVKDHGARAVRSDHLDVADRDAFGAYAGAVADQFGRVNVVVNNAGVSYSGPIEEIDYDGFDWIMGINFWGVVHGTMEFLPHLIASGDGHLVNISSLFGLVSMPGQATYNAAKYAVRGFTESVREDMLMARHPVGVSCVHPGGIRTNIVRGGRVTGGEDLADMADMFDAKLAKTTPEKAAQVIVGGILHNRPRVLIGADAHAVHTLAKLLGARYQDVFTAAARRTLPQRSR